jgi:leucyl-tRNA synthetase
VAEAEVTMVVQINGKVKARVLVAPSIGDDDATTAALADANIVAALNGATPTRVVARPPRLVNIIL